MSIWKTTVILIIGSTALAKLVGLFHPTQLLFQEDPVFKIRIIYVLASACLLEMFLCIYLRYCGVEKKGVRAVFAFAVLILAYRLISFGSGVAYCPCLGNIIDWWPWLGRHEESIMSSVAIWLFLTSAIQLIPERKRLESRIV
jgi:hypothetical protein